MISLLVDTSGWSLATLRYSKCKAANVEPGRCRLPTSVRAFSACRVGGRGEPGLPLCDDGVVFIQRDEVDVAGGTEFPLRA